MLIIFEGLYNCGKTTIVEMLKDYFVHVGKHAEFTREFETNIGIVIKEMAQAGSLDTILKSYLFAAYPSNSPPTIKTQPSAEIDQRRSAA